MTISRIVVNQSSLLVITKNATTLRFPVNRIFCVGRNYREHAIEMGHNPDREPPFFFLKPSDAIVDTSACTEAVSTTSRNDNRCAIPYPPKTACLHYEGELVVAIGRKGFCISPQSANEYIYGYALGCDLTKRDLQNEAKKKSRPWCASKGFDNSAPIGPITMKEECHDALFSQNSNNATTSTTTKSSSMDNPTIAQAGLSLSVNGSIRQRSSLDKMIWSVPEIISHLSQHFCLKPGDLIMTGTPEGVGTLEVGDSVSIHCEPLQPCEFVIGPKDCSS